MTPSQTHSPQTESFILSYPFKGIAADYPDLAGHNYLIAVDSFSNWPEVLKVNPVGNNAGAAGLMRTLKRYFATFGVPEELSSDGGPEFIAKETTDFLQQWGVKHHLSSVYNSRSNGRAEVTFRSMERLLADNISSTGETHTGAFTQAILKFRNTPDLDNGISPAEIIFRRPFRDALPIKTKLQIYDNSYVRPLHKKLWNKHEDTLRSRFAQQVETLNMKIRDVPALSVGDTCRIQRQTDRFSRKWDKTRRVV